MGFGKQRNSCVAAAVGGVVNVQTEHERLEYIIIIHIVGKMLAVESVDQIFTVRTVVKPTLIKREYFICNRNFPDAVFGFTVNNIKVLFRQVDIFFFQI